nr:muconolactone Delta-isomerase family protein [Acidianus brierleyi]
MLFLLWFKVKQPESLSQKRLMEIWEKEAEATMSAVKSGKINSRSSINNYSSKFIVYIII